MVAALFLAALCGGVEPAWAQEDGAREVPALEVSAWAWAVTDLKTGEYLAGSGASEELPMASTTKVMGALVALETDLDEEVIPFRVIDVTTPQRPQPTRSNR